MAIADFAVDRSAQSPVARGFHAVVRWFAARRAARAKRVALQNLLFASDYRLADLGISRDELLRAIEGHRN